MRGRSKVSLPRRQRMVHLDVTPFEIPVTMRNHDGMIVYTLERRTGEYLQASSTLVHTWPVVFISAPEFRRSLSKCVLQCFLEHLIRRVLSHCRAQFGQASFPPTQPKKSYRIVHAHPRVP